MAESNSATFTFRDEYIIGKSIYFHVNKFYGIIPSDDANNTDINFTDFAKNAALFSLPVKDVRGFLNNIDSGWVSGTTLMITFPFVAFPHHFGYWAEVLAPVYSHLAMGAANEAGIGGIKTVIIPNLRRSRVLASPWVAELIKMTITAGKQPGSPVPRLLFWDDLEIGPLNTWLGFERIMHIYNRHKHPKNGGRGFASPEVAEKFKLAMHEYVGIPAPPPDANPPLTITYLMGTDGSGVSNNKEVLEALQAAALAVDSAISVRPYSPTPSVPLSSYVATMARTGVLVGRHSPLLANSIFLPPGAAVVEILPCNWDFGGLSEVYYNLTASIGSIGHIAWRAPSPEWLTYASPQDTRYSTWTPVECSSTHCLDAHNRAAVKVNGTELQILVEDALRAVISGNRDGNMLRQKYPWPRRVELKGDTGLWWDRA